MAAIAARLHGMPLAIELAAARIKLLSPDAILGRLEHQLDVLSAGGRDLPERQQTLRGAIAWSYDLLDDGSRQLLDRLSVFAGRTDIEAAEAVTGPSSELGIDVVDGLMALADQSLVRVDESADGEPRFTLLESIREYADERLEARGERDTILGRHRDWFVTLAERAAKELSGDDQRRWLDRLELAHDDIRAILDRAAAQPDPPVAIGLAFTMWRFWQKHGFLGEARRRLEALEHEPWSRDDPRLRARLLEALGGVCWWQGDLAPMREYYEEALRIWEDIDDDGELANAYYNVSFSYALGPDGTFGTGDLEGKGEAYTRQALEAFRKIGDERGEANALWGLGTLIYFSDDETGGEPEFRQALELFRKTGDRTMESWALHMLGSSLIRQGRTAEARDAIDHAITPLPLGRRRGRPDADAVRPLVGGRPGRRPRARRAAARGGHEPLDRDRRTPRDDDRGRLRARWRAPVGADDAAARGHRAARRRGRRHDPGRGGRVRARGRFGRGGTRLILDAASRPQPIRILDGDDDDSVRRRHRRYRSRGPDPDLRQLRGGHGRAQVQAHLPLRLLPVLLRLLLSPLVAARLRQRR